MPQVTNNLELICGSVAVTGDLTNPLKVEKGKIKTKFQSALILTFFLS